MAIYHLSIKNISRSKGQSAVACASYRSGEKLQDEELGKSFDYTRRDNVVFTEIILCKNAPSEYKNRETLWNEVQRVEKASNARLAREWEVALPNELTFDQSIALVKEFAQSLADEGMCIDLAIHWNDGNHHAHIMGTTRPIKANGEWGQKEKKIYKLDENGQKIPQIDARTGEQKIGARGRKMWERVTVEANDWNRTEKVEEWRERWGEQCNKALEKACILERVDHRSYERQGIEQVPTIHEGYAARQLEKRGKSAERCHENVLIRKVNMVICSINSNIKGYVSLIKDTLEIYAVSHRNGLNFDLDSVKDEKIAIEKPQEQTNKAEELDSLIQRAIKRRKDEQKARQEKSWEDLTPMERAIRRREEELKTQKSHREKSSEELSPIESALRKREETTKKQPKKSRGRGFSL